MSRSARRPLTVGLLSGALACVLAGTAVGTPAAQASSTDAGISARVSGSIAVSPTNHVGGQAVTFSGRLGVGGRRRITLQQFMGRPGDVWFPVRGYAGYTAGDGSFRVRVPAPDMWGIRYRVVSAGIASPSVLLQSKLQGADLWVSGADRDAPDQAGTPSAGVPFGVSVDTTPVITGRRFGWGTPVFAGRGLTLQKRVGPTSWTTLARTTETSDGHGYFTGLTEPTPGTVVYRVRQEPLLAGGDRVGWSTSYPTYLMVDGSGPVQQPPAPATTRYDAWQPLQASGVSLTPTMRTSFSGYGWGRKLFDFDWERGQSLTDAPGTGAGGWVEYSDGTGRAAKVNGMLGLDAKREVNVQAGDLGTTMATMTGNARAYGRWEVRFKSETTENAGRDYDLRAELVPSASANYACGSRNILIGQVRPSTRALTIGVKNGARNWSATRPLTSTVGHPSLAVEVEPGHITWFYAGRPVGTVRTSLAVSRVPLTLRLSLVGHGTDEMNRASLGSDWQRGYAATTGRQVLTGAALEYGAQPNRCDS